MALYDSFQRYIRRQLERRGVGTNEVVVRGARMFHYDVRGEGKGPPLMLLHGLGGTANGFARVLLGLSKRYSRVVAPDLPGNGFSPLPQTGPLPLRDYLPLLQAYIDQVVGEPVMLVGNSLGGAMAFTLAADSPGHLKALALIAPAGARIAAETQAALLASMQPTSAAMARALMRRLFHKAPLTALLFASELQKIYGSPAVRAIVQEASSIEPLTPEQLRSIAHPTLLLWGANEKVLPAEMLSYYREHLPTHAKIEVVDGFGHVPQVEQPRRVIERLSRFADEIGLG